MCAIVIDCKITQFFSRARAHSREKCVKIDEVTECVVRVV